MTTTISLSGLTTCPVGWICSATPCYYFSTNLGIGSTGQDVIALQSFLTTQMSKRIIPMSPFTSGVFDTFTATALMAYQRVIGVPATGYFGVMTRTIVNASCSVRPPCSNTNYLSPDYLTCPKPVSPQVSVSLDPSSPVSSIVMSTSSVPLLVFDLTAKGGPVNLQSISILFNVSGANGSSGSLTNAYIYSGSKLIASTIVINSPQTGSVANFNMQNMALAANVTIPFTVKLDTIPGPSGIIVSASVNPVAVFANSSSGVASPTGSALGSPITIVSPSNSFVTLGNTSTNLGSLISNQNAPEIQQVTFSFTLTALNAPVFISNNVSTAVTKSITGDIT